MIFRHLLLFTLVIIFASCSTTQYVVDSLGTIETTRYSTYTMEDNCADDINPIMQLRIKNALEQTLRANNFEKDANADLLIKYFVKNVSKKYIEECREEYARWEGGKLCEERVVNYVEGSLVVDIIDTQTNSIIWHGAAYGPSWSRIKDPNKKVNAVIENLMNKFFHT